MEISAISTALLVLALLCLDMCQKKKKVKVNHWLHQLWKGKYQNFFIQFRLDFRNNMAQSDSSIKILTSQFEEDGKLKRVFKYEHLSKASLQSNEFLIEGILIFLATMSSPIANFPPLLQRSPKNLKKRKSMLKVTANSWWKVRKPRTHFTLVICWVDIVLVPWDQPVHFKIALFSVAPVSDPKMRAIYHFIALGKVLPAN